MYLQISIIKWLIEVKLVFYIRLTVVKNLYETQDYTPEKNYLQGKHLPIIRIGGHRLASQGVYDSFSNNKYGKFLSNRKNRETG